MMLILSNAVAKKWGVELERLESLPDYPPAWLWRLDVMQVGNRKSNLICTNIPSFYSVALMDLKRMPMKETILRVINRIGDALYANGMPAHYVRASVASFEFGKYNDRRLIGIVNDQKYRYEYALFNPHRDWVSINDVDANINLAPTGGPKYVYPNEEFPRCVDASMKVIPNREALIRDELLNGMLQGRKN